MFGYLLSITSVDVFAFYVSIYVVLFCFWGFVLTAIFMIFLCLLIYLVSM